VPASISLLVTPKPAFLFDLDGTLADTLPDIAATTNHVRRLHGLAPADTTTVRTFIGDGAKTLLRRALAELAPREEVGRDALEGAFAAYIEHHREQCTGHAQLYPGVREHLTALTEQGGSIAIVTNKPEQFALPLAHHLGLDEFTSVIIGGDTLSTKKPDPAMLAHALARLGASPTNATMIGDGLQDLRAGRALGLRTIACLFGYGDPTALQAEGADEYWAAVARPIRPR
jgi:phosphoglycolate phosphatase